MSDTEVPKKTTKQRAHAVESSQSLHPIAMLYDGRMRNYQRKGFMMNIRRENVSNVAEEMLQIYPNHLSPQNLGENMLFIISTAFVSVF